MAKVKPPETLAEILKRLRTSAGLSQGQLATRMCCHLSAITRLEQGITTDPQWSTIQLLAGALEVSADEFRSVCPRA